MGYDVHKRDEFDVKLGRFVSNPDEFAATFKQIINTAGRTDSANRIMSTFGNMNNTEDIKKFYQGNNVGVYEKTQGLLDDIMTEDNEITVLALIGALDMKTVAAMDKQQEASYDKIPDFVEAPEASESAYERSYE